MQPPGLSNGMMFGEISTAKEAVSTLNLSEMLFGGNAAPELPPLVKPTLATQVSVCVHNSPQHGNKILV